MRVWENSWHQWGRVFEQLSQVHIATRKNAFDYGVVVSASAFYTYVENGPLSYTDPTGHALGGNPGPPLEAPLSEMDALDMAVSSQDFLSDPVFGGLFSGSTQVGTTGGVGSMSPSGVPPVASGNYVVLDSSKKDSSGNPTVVGVVVDLSTQLGQQIASRFSGGTYKFDASSGVLSESGASSGASGASGGTSQGGTQQSLTYRTVSGGPGQNSWRVVWELSEASPDGGFIVQEVDVSEAITQPDGHTNIKTKPSMWEAWTVLAGHTNAEPTNSQGYDDDFLFKDVRSTDPLSTTITGTARFFEGLTRATVRGDGFQPGNTTSQSGNLLTSKQDPNLSVQNATAPVNRKDTYVNPMQKPW